MSSESDKQILLNAEKTIARNLRLQDLMEAEITRLRKLVAAKDEALRVLADPNNWDAGEWTADLGLINGVLVWQFARAALELK